MTAGVEKKEGETETHRRRAPVKMQLVQCLRKMRKVEVPVNDGTAIRGGPFPLSDPKGSSLDISVRSGPLETDQFGENGEEERADELTSSVPGCLRVGSGGAGRRGGMMSELERVAFSPRTSSRRGRTGSPGRFPGRVCLAQRDEEGAPARLCTKKERHSCGP